MTAIQQMELKRGIMQNPLTDLEKRIILQNFSHDIRGSLGNLYHLFGTKGENYDPKWGNSNVTHIKNSMAALEFLARDNVYFENVTSSDIALRLEQDKAAVQRKNGHINLNVQNLTDFQTQIDVLGLALYTLMGNSALQVPNGRGNIIVTASDYEGDISDIIYQSPNSPVSGKFKRFRIQDTGQGFTYGTKFFKSEEKDMDSDTCDNFGLRLTRIICKYLMSHFSITTKTNELSQGGADISIYHPADLESVYLMHNSAKLTRAS